MIAGDAFVTPHAVTRFRELIAPLAYEHALAGIIKSLAAPKSVKPCSNGKGVTVRTVTPFRFRAVVVAGSRPDDKPVVVTLMRG